MKISTSGKISNLLTTGFIFIFVLTYMIIGYYTLEEESRRMPMMTGYVTIFLLALDMFMGLRSKNGNQEKDHEMTDVSFGREIKAILYVGALALGIYVAGFLVALPLYLIVSMVYQGRQTYKLAVLVALPASVAIYVVFELLLELHLYTGVIFS